MPARTRKGDRFLKQGAQAEAAKDFDAALAYYNQAVDADPNEPAYLLADQRMRSQAAQSHLTVAKKLQAAGQLEAAASEFQKAFLADPGSEVAVQGLRETNDMIKQHAASPGTPVMTAAERARMETEKRLASLEGPPVLRPLKSQIEYLSMNNQPARLLYESAAKLAGINVIFDPAGIEAVAGKNFNLDLRNLTLDEALNYIALETHTFWKAISHNAIFVTQESDQKRQEYQDEVVRVFYIQNASTQAEFQEITNAIRTVGKLTTGLFQVTGQNAIIVRGTVDTMQIVEKIVRDLDRAKAEVVIDVLVLSVNRTKSSTLGANILGQGGLSVPGTFTPRSPTPSSTTTGGSTTTTPTTASNQVRLSQLSRLSTSDYSTTLPNALLQALMNDATTRVLQRPQVRATDGGKSSLLIGQQIPYVSGSLNSAVATPGAIPYATTQFQQINVGTTVEFAPHVNGLEDISMKVKVEISNKLNDVSIAGITQPVIGKQTDEADIRMKDGEVAILANLSDKELSNTLSGVPGIANIPILNYIFGQRAKNNVDNNIMIALIPHIVRAQDAITSTDLGVYAGSERTIKVNRKTDANPVTPLPSAPAPPVAQPGSVSPLSPASGSTRTPAGAPGVPNPPTGTPPRP